MDYNSNNSPNDFLWSLLENPANDASSCAYDLHRLVNDFPQSGILQALLAHASEEKNLKRASAYFNPRALFKLINAPSTFTGVPDERIVIQPGISVNGSYRQPEPSFYTESFNAYAAEDLVADKSAPPVEANEEQVSPPPVDELIVDHHAEEYLSHLSEDGHPADPRQQTEEEIAAVHESPFGHLEPSVEEEPATNHEAIPEYAGRHSEDEAHAVHETAPKEEEIESRVDHQVVAVPETAAEETELPVAEQLAEKPVTDSHPPQPETEAGEHLQAEVHEHLDEELPPPIPETLAERPAKQLTETEFTGQTTGSEPAKDEPVPVIDLAEEKPAEIVSEIPVEEDIKPQIEIPVKDESIPEPEIPAQTEMIAAPETAGDEADEIYDEIVGIEDINLGQQSKGQFFSFDHEFGAHEDKEERENRSAPLAPAEGGTEQQDVSRYHDEKMPYTFMWWLDKTRKEHAQIYQPYVKPPAAPKKAKRTSDELQQQYFENIFHITSVDELDKSIPPGPASPDFKRKEQLIIERFIKEEPQIKPQSSDKLDNENKAKKSSEDRDELVSETLAGIYSDQMLYHKAIASYKKLILKFPEKSRYFADKIEQLEKKTN